MKLDIWCNLVYEMLSMGVGWHRRLMLQVMDGSAACWTTTGPNGGGVMINVAQKYFYVKTKDRCTHAVPRCCKPLTCACALPSLMCVHSCEHAYVCTRLDMLARASVYTPRTIGYGHLSINTLALHIAIYLQARTFLRVAGREPRQKQVEARRVAEAGRHDGGLGTREIASQLLGSMPCHLGSMTCMSPLHERP